MAAARRLVSAPRPIYNHKPQMAPRFLALALSIGLLLLIGPTPYPARLAEQLQAARTALRAGRHELALPQLELALERQPGLVEDNLELVDLALRAEQPEVAQALIGSLSPPASASREVACLQAQVAAQLQDWPASLRSIEAAGPSCRQPLTELEGLAEELMAAGDFDQARRLLDGLVGADPGSARAQLQLGILESLEQPEQAMGRLLAAVELGSESRLAQELIQVIQEAEDAGDPAYTLAQVGQVLARAGEWLLAVQAFSSALAIEPGYTEARAYRGLALDRAGQSGLADLEQAVEEAPEAALPRQLLGRHWRAQGEPALAQSAFEAAATLAPDDPLIAADLAAAYAGVGDLQSARAAYIHAAELAPHDPMLWLVLAQFALEFDIEPRGLGIPAARRALALQPDSAEAMDLLGYAYYVVGDWSLAERFLQRAMATDPNLAAAHYHLGLLKLSRGQTAAGRQSLQLARRLDPDGRIGSLAQRSLENLP